jgi:endonuclease/exonuclease/phosphatase family metal-dependent hydrolase
MKRLIFILAVAVFLAGCSACSTPTEAPQTFTAALWNVQTLFDGHEAGNEFRDFREAAGWTVEKYQARITAISQAILHMAPPGTTPPALIGFSEIENLEVLYDLAGGSLAKHGYNWAAFSALPGAALGLGVLSSFPIKDLRAHSITVKNGTAPRPVLELRVEPRGEPIVFLLCHWKSKLGNDTELLRRASARVVQRRLMELLETEPETPVIVMGDLNENHDEFFRYAGRSIDFYALLPDDPDVAELAAQLLPNTRDFLVLSTEKPPRSLIEGIPALYSAWEDMQRGTSASGPGAGSEAGSYYFRGGWETIDHILLSEGLFNDMGWVYSESRVLNHEPFITSSGTPNRYIPRSGRGLSDHLPLLLYLRYLD